MTIIFSDNGLPMLLNFRGDVIEHFRAEGHRIVLVYPRCTETEVTLARVPQGCITYAVDVEPTAVHPLQDLRYMRTLRSIYKKEQPDVIFHYTIKPNIYGTLAAKSLGIRCVDMVAGLGYVFAGNGLKHRIARTMYRAGLRRADRVICLNSYNLAVLASGRFARPERLVLFEGGEGVNLNTFAV